MRHWLILGLLFALLPSAASAQSGYRSNKTVRGYRITPLYVKAPASDSLKAPSPETETPPGSAMMPVEPERMVPSGQAPDSPLAPNWQAVGQQLEEIQTQLAALSQAQSAPVETAAGSPPPLAQSGELDTAISPTIEQKAGREAITEPMGSRDTILVQNQIFLNAGSLSQDSLVKQLIERQEQLQSRWEAWLEAQNEAEESSPRQVTIRTITEGTSPPAPAPVTIVQPQADTIPWQAWEASQQALMDSLRDWKRQLRTPQPVLSYPPVAFPVSDSLAMDSLGMTDGLFQAGGGRDTAIYYSDPVALYQLKVLQQEVAALKSLLNQSPRPVAQAPTAADSAQTAALAELQAMLAQLQRTQQSASSDQQATIAALQQQLAQQDSLAKLPPPEPTGWQGLRMARVFFETGQSTLEAQDRLELEEMALLLREQPQLRVEIRGFADKTGNAALNQRLSQRRANSVQTYLESLGIAADRMEVVFFGDEKASYGGALDRRVEVVLMEKKQ